MDAKTIARFRAKIDLDGPEHPHRPELGPCHVWTAGKDTHGYGQFRLRGKNQRVHRVAFYLAHGRWPEPCGLHSCDRRWCCNERHIFEGTNADNNDDCRTKGRRREQGWARSEPRVPRREFAARGEAQGLAKLTEQDVRDIRANYGIAGVRQKDLAKRYGVTPQAVWAVIRRQTWTHI
jgi:hypothetical protein